MKEKKIHWDVHSKLEKHFRHAHEKKGVSFYRGTEADVTIDWLYHDREKSFLFGVEVKRKLERIDDIRRALEQCHSYLNARYPWHGEEAVPDAVFLAAPDLPKVFSKLVDRQTRQMLVGEVGILDYESEDVSLVLCNGDLIWSESRGYTGNAATLMQARVGSRYVNVSGGSGRDFSEDATSEKGEREKGDDERMKTYQLLDAKKLIQR